MKQNKIGRRASKASFGARYMNSGISTIFRDRGLSGTLGLMVTWSAAPALAHEAITTPVVVPTAPVSHSTAVISPSTTNYTHHSTNSSSTSSSNSSGGSNTGHSSNHNSAWSTNVTSSSTSQHNNTGSTGSHNSATGSNNSTGENSTGASNQGAVGGSSGSSSPSSNASANSSNSNNSNNSNTSSTSHTGHASNVNTSNNSNTSNSTGSNSGSHTHHSSNHVAANSTSTTPQTLNLGSNATTFTLGALGNYKTVTIDVGGTVEKVTSTTKLTSAELLAADQALHSGPGSSQGLTINSQGVATGGEFTLTGQTLRTLDASTGGISSLIIPAQVTLADNLKSLNISGDLTNSGTILAQSTSSAGNTIKADDIINAAGATISGSGSLTLNASGTLSNAGTISSSNNLSIAATSLQNTSPSGTPSITAGGSLTLNAPTVTNSGVLAAGTNLNLTSPQSITVQQTSNANFTAGSNINFRDSTYTGSGNISINGGNFLSQQLNIYAPQGQVDLVAGNITGSLNGDVSAIHTDTQSNTLVLGNLAISGDPEFYNTGNLAIGGQIQTNGVPLALVATGNIISNGGSFNTGGGALTIIAGASFSTNDGTTGTGNNAATGSNEDWSTVLTINGASPTGGYIDLTGNSGGTAPITAISTSTGNVDGNGGNVTMVAYAGSQLASGTIGIPSTLTINTDGKDYSSTVLSLNGNVTLIAPGTSNGAAINMGNITANTAGGGGGIITLSTGVPAAVGTTIAGVASPYEIVNGQPYGSFTSSGVGNGNITFGTINGFQATYNTTQVGGSFSASTNGTINANGNITDGGISISTGQNFLQTTNWTAGGISIITQGYFAQTTSSTVVLDGVGGTYHIGANPYVNFEGDTIVSGGISPASLTVSTAAGSTDYIGYLNGTGFITADIASFTGASNVVVNGILQTPSNPDSPPGGGNLSFINNAGNLTISGTGQIANSGTFTATASGNVVLSTAGGLRVNTSSNPNGWVFSAGGSLTLPYTGLTVAPDPMTGNGGTVKLSYGPTGFFYNQSTPTPFVIEANGANSGTTQNGGMVSIIANDPYYQTINNLGSSFIISADSGSLGTAFGGNISFASNATLSVNPTYITNTGTGTGGSVNFITSSNIAIYGNLSEAPTGGSPVNYGTIQISTPSSSNAFIIGQTPVNGISGSLTGNVNVTNPVNIVVAQGASIEGNAISLTAPTMTNSGTILGTLVGTQVTSTVALNTPFFNNTTTGEIGANSGTNGQSLVSITSPSSLTIVGAGTWLNTFGYQFTGATSVNLGPLFVPSNKAADPVFDQLTLNAGTNLTINTASLTTDGGATGKISISANTLTYPTPTTSAFTLNADGSTNSSDGIIVNLTGTAAQTIGTAAGDFILQAVQGANGGAISFTNGGGLSVSVNPAALDNTNGNLSLIAGGNLQVLGPIAQGTGNVTLASNGSNFTIGSPQPVNGVFGNITGTVVTINEASLTVNNGYTVSGSQLVFNTGAFQNYGTLTSTGTFAANGTGSSAFNFLNDGSITAPTEISVTSNGNLTISGTGTYGTTVQYDFTGNNVNLGPLFATSTSNQFSNLTIDATGLITLATNTLQTLGLATNSINITGSGVSYLNSGSTPLTLNASSPTGGGNVSYTLTGTTPIVIGGAGGQITIYTTETTIPMTGGQTGSITIANGGGITINPNYLYTNTVNDPNASTNIALTATSGNLLISTGNAATGWSAGLLGPAGDLSITTSSSNPFIIGPTASMVNGIYTSVGITGGSITILNNAGAINLNLANALQAQVNGGSVNLTAAGAISGLSGVQTISAPSITLASTGGTIGSSTNPLIVNTPTGASASILTLSSPTGVYVTDNSPGFLTNGVNILTFMATAPIVSLTDNNANAPLIDLPQGLPNSSTVTIIAPGQAGGSAQGIRTEGTIGNQTGTITLNAGITGSTTGPSTITENPAVVTNGYAPIFIEGTTVSLTASGVTNTNPTNSNFQTILNALTYNGTMLTTQLIVNNNYFPTTLNAGTTVNFNYRTDGSLIISGTQTSSGALDITSWGQLIVNAPINSSGTVTLQTVSGGPITSLNNSTVTASTLNLNSDYGSFSTLNVSAPTLNLNTAGVINLSDLATTTALTVQNTPMSIQLLASGALDVDSGISTSNGNISLESTNTSTGTITVAANETLHASSTLPNLGAVYISIGTLPAQPLAGVIPGNVIITSTGGAAVYFGSSTYPNGSITASGAPSNLNASGRNIIFNSSGRSSAITLDGGDTITADPPLASGVNAIASQQPTGGVLGTLSNAVLSYPLTLATGAAPTSNVTNALLPSAPTIQPYLTASPSSIGSFISNSGPGSLSNLLIEASGNSGGVSASIVGSSAQNAVVTPVSLSTTSSGNAISLSQASLTQAIPSSTQSASAAVTSLNSAAIAPNKEPLMGGVVRKRHVHNAISLSEKSNEVIKALNDGPYILSPLRDTVFESRFGKLEVAAKSLVFVVLTDKALSVYNLHDESRDSVVVTSNGKVTDVYPGRHITVGDSKSEGFEQTNPVPFIPHRGMRVYDCGDLKLYASEFDIQSAIRGYAPLKAMLSSEDIYKQKLAGKVFKTIAILQVLSGKHGNYEQIVPKPVTAYNN